MRKSKKGKIPSKIYNPDVATGRYCDLEGISEVKDLKKGMDFRLPQYRREVFLRFYEFHLKYGTHPGLVYLFFPKIFDILGFEREHKLWWCYINGCTQNPFTTWVIFMNFPNFNEIVEKDFEAWHRLNWKKLDYDIDRRYQKGHMVEMWANYNSLIGNQTQGEFFDRICNTSDPYENFDRLWDLVINNFHMYGRLSTFSYLEYLKIAGLPIDCSNLFMYDIEGSKSHRNGIAKIMGRDDLDWHKDNPTFNGYNEQVIDWLEEEAENLLKEAKVRFKGTPFYNDVNFFTLESTFCCYKSWHRVNRRYPNVYTDMAYKRLLKAESMGWGKQGLDFNIFREIINENLPPHLWVENNPKDVGLKPEKMNHYRLTGQVIMMDREWDCFVNDYNKGLI